LSSDAQIALSGNAEYEKKQVENRTQISLVEVILVIIRVAIIHLQQLIDKILSAT